MTDGIKHQERPVLCSTSGVQRGVADGATAPGIRPGGHPRGQFS